MKIDKFFFFLSLNLFPFNKNKTKPFFFDPAGGTMLPLAAIISFDLIKGYNCNITVPRRYACFRRVGPGETLPLSKQKKIYTILFSNCILMVLYVSAPKSENYKLVLSLPLDCCLYFFCSSNA